MLEYQLDQIKIVDFLLLAKFWACLLFFLSPSIINELEQITNDTNAGQSMMIPMLEFQDTMEAASKKGESIEAKNFANVE